MTQRLLNHPIDQMDALKTPAVDQVEGLDDHEEVHRSRACGGDGRSRPPASQA